MLKCKAQEKQISLRVDSSMLIGLLAIFLTLDCLRADMGTYGQPGGRALSSGHHSHELKNLFLFMQ